MENYQLVVERTKRFSMAVCRSAVEQATARLSSTRARLERVFLHPDLRVELDQLLAYAASALEVLAGVPDLLVPVLGENEEDSFRNWLLALSKLGEKERVFRERRALLSEEAPAYPEDFPHQEAELAALREAEKALKEAEWEAAWRSCRHFTIGDAGQVILRFCRGLEDVLNRVPSLGVGREVVWPGEWCREVLRYCLDCQSQEVITFLSEWKVTTPEMQLRAWRRFAELAALRPAAAALREWVTSEGLKVGGSLVPVLEFDDVYRRALADLDRMYTMMLENWRAWLDSIERRIPLVRM